MASVTAQHEEGRLVITMPQDSLPTDQAVRLLQLFLDATPGTREACMNILGQDDMTTDEHRYMALLSQSLQNRDSEAIAFAQADLFALSEAEKLGIALTARQRHTLIHYYIERQPLGDTPPATGGSSQEAALTRAAMLVEKLRKKR